MDYIGKTMNLWSINTVNGSQFHFLERWTCTFSMTPVQHGLCGCSEGRYTVIILHGPLGMSSQSFATDVQWGSEEKQRRKGPEGAATAPPSPTHQRLSSYHGTFWLGSAGRVSPHSFFCISLITNTIEFLLYIWVTGMSPFGNVHPCLYC